MATERFAHAPLDAIAFMRLAQNLTRGEADTWGKRRLQD
jgi:hypothetical protein